MLQVNKLANIEEKQIFIVSEKIAPILFWIPALYVPNLNEIFYYFL